MRLFPAALAVAFAALSVSTSLHGQPADAPINPRSMALLAQGKAAAAAGNLEAATDLIETALAVDPRNRAAFLVLAEVAERQQLPGKAIKLYREALLIEPRSNRAGKIDEHAQCIGQGDPIGEKRAQARAEHHGAAQFKNAAQARRAINAALEGDAHLRKP